MKTVHTFQKPRQRRFFLLLPLLSLPFLTLAFWALGGGSGKEEKPTAAKGLNTELPEAALEQKHQDKLSLYEQARRDSIQKQSRAGLAFLSQLGLESPSAPFDTSTFQTEGPTPDVKTQEKQIMRQMELLSQEVNRTTRPPSPVLNPASPPYQQNGSPMWPSNTNADRLEKLISSRPVNDEEDPEMRQLESMLEKILDIQHPERVKQRLLSQNTSFQPQANMVFAASDTGALAPRNTIWAVVHSDQDLVTGAMAKLRLLEDILVNGSLLPRNSFLHGTCSMEGTRLKIQVKSIRSQESIVPVSLAAHDLDGQEGLYIPGSITQDAVQGGTDNVLQNVRIMTMDPSVTAQAAEIGIQTAKGLFRRKNKQVKVTVKAGHRLLLKDTDLLK